MTPKIRENSNVEHWIFFYFQSIACCFEENYIKNYQDIILESTLRARLLYVIIIWKDTCKNADILHVFCLSLDLCRINVLK